MTGHRRQTLPTINSEGRSAVASLIIHTVVEAKPMVVSQCFRVGWGPQGCTCPKNTLALPDGR